MHARIDRLGVAASDLRFSDRLEKVRRATKSLPHWCKCLGCYLAMLPPAAVSWWLLTGHFWPLAVLRAL